MGRGESKAGGGSGGIVAGGANVDVISENDMVSARESASTGSRESIDDVLTVAKAMDEKYGDSGVITGTFQIATLGGKDGASVMGFYDGMSGDIAINKKFMDRKTMTDAYDDCVKQGFHPPRGRKSGVEAVASHEMGHAINGALAKKQGKSLYDSADSVLERAVTDAWGKTSEGKKGKIISKRQMRMSKKSFASHISGYAKTDSAETIAEACADVYCNGRKAKQESRMIVNAMDKMLKE